MSIYHSSPVLAIGQTAGLAVFWGFLKGGSTEGVPLWCLPLEVPRGEGAMWRRWQWEVGRALAAGSLLFLGPSCPPTETLPSDLSPYSPASPAAEPVSHGALSPREPSCFAIDRGLCISWFPVQLSVAAPRESPSGSDFNLTGWTLEATCWKDSQVTAPSQRVEEHTQAPGESNLTFGIWSCFDEALTFELQASVRRNLRQKRALGFLRKRFSTTSHCHWNVSSIIKSLTYVSPALHRSNWVSLSR